MNHSYIVTCKATGQVVFETWQKSIADAINTDKYLVQTAYDYLCDLNKSIKDK